VLAITLHRRALDATRRRAYAARYPKRPYLFKPPHPRTAPPAAAAAEARILGRQDWLYQMYEPGPLLVSTTPQNLGWARRGAGGTTGPPPPSPSRPQALQQWRRPTVRAPPSQVLERKL
jgi:hypothetical protein